MRPPGRILVVDDDDTNREALVAMLESLGYVAETARDGLEALAKLRLDIDLMMLDIMMPGMDGFDVVEQLRRDSDFENLPVIMVTALSHQEDRVRAFEAGANDFIVKPIDRAELRVRTESLLRIKAAQDRLRRQQHELEGEVERQLGALRTALEDSAEAQRQTYRAHIDTIQRLVLAAEFKDQDTAAHIQRISLYCEMIARSLNLPPREIEVLKIASPMHDVGKIGIPDLILLKPDRLTPEEMEIMKQHTTIGARLLHDSPSELLQAGEIIALSHHEKWDGSGYPNSLSGEDIPMWGRICAVADVFDALTSKRPYKSAMPNEKAIEIMSAGRGSHFDPDLFDLFIDHLDEVRAIQADHNDDEGAEMLDSLYDFR